jgi:hypothetical protein
MKAKFGNLLKDLDKQEASERFTWFIAGLCQGANLESDNINLGQIYLDLVEISKMEFK